MAARDELITREELDRFLSRAELDVDDWQLDLMVKILNSDEPLELRLSRR